MKRPVFLLLLMIVCLVFTSCRIERIENIDGSETTGEEEPEVEVGSSGLAYVPHSGENSCTIVGLGSCTDTVVTVPKTIDGLTVVAIGRQAFAECLSMTEVILPAGLLRIEAEAFSGCTALTRVTVSSSVKQIGSGAFLGCSSLTEAIFEAPNGWSASGNAQAPEDLSDPGTAAGMLRMLGDFVWERR